MEKSAIQFCTVSRSAEVLCERWTPLVVRELLCGSRRFNDLHRGVPRMSTGLLAQRLRKLEEVGVVRRVPGTGTSAEYHLTSAGEELRPIVMALGHWGARWIGSRLREDELDAGLLMWDMRRFARVEEFPPKPVVIHFQLRDARAPVPESHHHRPQRFAGLGELVFPDLAGGHPLHDAAVLQVAQPLRQQAGGHACHAAVQVVEPPAAAQQLAHHERRPPLAQDLGAARNGGTGHSFRP